MKRKYLVAAAALLAAMGASANITVTMPKVFKGHKMVVASQSVSELLSGAPVLNADTLKIKKNKMTVKTNVAEPTVYFITIDGNLSPSLFMLPGENATLTVKSAIPYEAEVGGTPLNDGITAFEALSAPYGERMDAARNGISYEDPQKIYDDYLAAVENFINENKNSLAGVYALLALSDAPFMKYYEEMKPLVESSPFASYLENKAESMKRAAEAEKKQKEMEENHVLAPDFTLEDLQGGQFTLSSIRGKWVVIDFWGSWCGWCIKGFPALKEAYKKYDGKLEVVGVDCGDTPEAWKAAVAKFSLPWINVYNPKSETSVDKVYGIQGFPTKVIVDPEGRIARIVTGEDPQFYTILENLINPAE